MPSFRPISLLLALSLLGVAEARAQEAGGYSGAYLRQAALAQEVAMGGAYTPFPANASAIFTSSANLARLQHPAALVSASFLPHNQGLFLIGFGMKVGPSAGLSFGMLRYGINDVSSYDDEERPIGTINSSDFAFSIGGGLAIGPGNVGATLRYLRSTIGRNEGEAGGVQGEGSSGGYSVDLSGTMEFETRLLRNDWIYFSMALNNIAGEMNAGHDPIPWDARLGASYLFPLEEENIATRLDPSGLASTQRVKPRAYVLGAFQTRIGEHDSDPSYSFAAESVPLVNVPVGLRAGLNSLGDISGGFFFTIPWEFARNLRIDLASRRDYEIGEISHHVTITGGF